MNKYIRFATRIPSNEVALAVDVDQALKRQEALSKDIIEAREKYSPKARISRKTKKTSSSASSKTPKSRPKVPNRYATKTSD